MYNIIIWNKIYYRNVHIKQDIHFMSDESLDIIFKEE